jgi:crotonobetainyl-CoA:carnitine CoA-transferase CaiB-like acyl-CoA transferase
MTPPHFPPHAPRPSGAPTALEGLRVLDFSRMMAGPWCSLALADLGGEVIKVESPEGDDSRYYAPQLDGKESAFHLSTNRNKKSIALDLKHPDGQRIARELAARSDILLENFSNGVMERLGLDYPSLARLNPGLIYCSVSGYGRDDPSPVARRGYDAMFQAETGFMSMTGEPDGMPMRAAIPVMDLATAITATNAILAAVIARGRLGRGQHIDMALFDVGISLLSLFGMPYLVGAEEPRREGNRSSQTAPSDVYETVDGPIFVTSGNDRVFRRLATEALGRPDLLADPDFSSNLLRLRHREKLTRILREVFRADTQANWIARLTAAGIPVAPVRRMSQAYHSPDAARRRLVTRIPHPRFGSVPNVRSPYVMSLTPPVDPVAPPSIGQHTEEILRDVLGLGEAGIATLRSSGACRTDG